MAEEIKYENLALELSNIGELVRENMVNRLLDQDAVITGALARSITPKDVVFTGEGVVLPISLLEYGIYVDNGAERRAGKMPPLAPIEAWLKKRNIKPRDANMKPKTLAFLIAKSIGEKGQRFKQPKPFIQVSLDYVVEQQVRNDNIGEAVALDIDTNIQQNWSEIPTST